MILPQQAFRAKLVVLYYSRSVKREFDEGERLQILLPPLTRWNGHAMTDSFTERYDNTGQPGLRLPEPVQCFRCGECCRRYQVLLEPGEADRLAERLGLGLIELKALYADPRWPGTDKFLLRQTATSCPFLTQKDKEFKCTIHDIRPRACREWSAGLDRRECREGLAACWQLSLNAENEVEGPPAQVEAFRDFLNGLDA
jgi:uncharacterized protein